MVLSAGCATRTTEPATGRGAAEVRIDTAPLAEPITRVTVEVAGISQDLVLTPGTADYAGTIFLPGGPQSPVASAFSGETLVAQSQPTPVVVQSGVVTRLMIRMIDLDPQAIPPVYGPIFDSMSFPTTTEAGASPSFTISAIAPDGAALSYAWSSDCADSTFSAPGAASTVWTKPVPGTCTISVTVASNGFSLARSFAIVVFPAGVESGAVDIESTIVTAPQMFLRLPEVGCDLTPGDNASCPFPIAAPRVTGFQVGVFDWQGGLPGSVEISDNCGGRFGKDAEGSDGSSGVWLPPLGGGLCIVTGRAVSGDGLTSTISAAVLTRPGTPRIAQPPVVFMSLDTGCFVNSVSGPQDCGTVTGAARTVTVQVSWQDGDPDLVTITDSCAGELTGSGQSFQQLTWTVPSLPSSCSVTVHAVSLEGSSADAVMSYEAVAQ